MGPSPRIDALRRRVEADPASIAFAQLAEEYRRAGQLAEAVDTCRAGLLKHPDYHSARVTLGRALLALGRVDDAAAELRCVVDAAPGNLAARRALAEACRRLGRTREALEHITAARALAPDEPDLERITIELNHALASPATDAESPSASGDAATLAALEQWLEAIHAERADRRA